jgi:pre-mRNA-splicing helicase BRR2
MIAILQDAEDDENYMEYEPAASDEDEDDGAQNAEEEDTDGRAVRTRDGEAQADAADELYIDPRNIDAYWLQREVKQHYADADQAQSVASSILKALGDRSMDDRECEDQLVSLLDYEHFELVKLFLHNRLAIVYATKYARASESEKKDIEKEMAEDDDLAAIFAAMTAEGDTKTSFERSLRREARNLSSRNADAMDADDDDMKLPYAAEVRGAQTLDLESLAFTSGAHTMTNKTVKLPPGSYRNPKKGYEEVFVPAVQHQFTSADGEMPITEMPEWSHDGFQGMKFLNRVQTKLYKCAFESSDNFLLCAPTGSGKTNVAMLAIMHEIGMHIDKRTKRVDLDAFKIVYIAPMKSLVQEMVHNFGLRLKPYGITVREMSGDASLTKAEVAETQVLVTTPEKWDIITRKSGDRTYTQLVRLVIMDEIHLLHDDRGPVLESIVARTIRQIESTQEMVRLVGLSATLPNYEDVATFLRVKKENVFAFPNSWRPVPLEQVFIGINVKKPFKRFQMMNELCYEKVIEQAGEQVR